MEDPGLTIDNWRVLHLYLGESLWELLVLLESLQCDQDVETAWRQLSNALKAVMDALLEVPLMGRPGLSKSRTLFTERILVYASKFPLSDIFIMLAALLCRNVVREQPRTPVSEVPVRCQCVICRCLYRLRLQYVFFGPSYGLTPWDLAAARGNEELIEMLRKYGGGPLPVWCLQS